MKQAGIESIKGSDVRRGDFQNSEVFITRPGDPRLPCDMPGKSCFFQQDCEGPTFITVRSTATDAQLSRLAERFQVELSELQEVRDSQILETAPGMLQ